MKKIIIPLIAVFAILLFSCESTQIINDSPDLSKLSDGVYDGYSKGAMNSASVRVSIDSQRISVVELIKLDATSFGQKAKDSIPARIVRKQSPYVDAVSGATEASHVIINATVDALKKAKK